jgi:muramoyltetrapeptide carboxypeptidase
MVDKNRSKSGNSVNVSKIPMRKPRRLRKGDTIGIAAPASPFDPDELERGRAVLHDMGYKTRLAEDLMARSGYLAGADDHRATQLERILCDPQVHAVMCARGGYGTLRILNRLDYDLVRVHAKPLIGFSDITALHHAFGQVAGVITFHGPVVTTMAHADPATRHALVTAVAGNDPCRIVSDRTQEIIAGKASGPVAGGNLTVLSHLIGTPYHPVFKDRIVVLEDCAEAPYRIDRMLTQMKMAGCFDDVAGLVIGSFFRCGRKSELFAVIKACFTDLRVPVAAGFSVGHDGGNLTVPLGIAASLDTAKGELKYLECATIE